MTKIKYCTALITGGSSGIGFETASLFLSKGYKVFICGLEMEELQLSLGLLSQEGQGDRVAGICIDLTKAGAIPDLYKKALVFLGRVDVLINNAGFGNYGALASIEIEKEQKMLRLNILALHELSCTALADMVKEDRGHILNISSISAFQPAPMLASYAASKAFVLQFTMSMHYELRNMKSKVGATAICPTQVRTNFEKTANMEATSLYKSWLVSDVKLVAETIYSALNSSRSYIVPGKVFDFINKISKRLPVFVLASIARRQL